MSKNVAFRHFQPRKKTRDLIGSLVEEFPAIPKKPEHAEVIIGRENKKEKPYFAKVLAYVGKDKFFSEAFGENPIASLKRADKKIRRQYWKRRDKFLERPRKAKPPQKAS